MRKGIYIILALLLSLSLWADKPYTVVLDPGHGGKDPGAVGKFSKEKDLNLSLALQVGKMLNKQYPDVKVVYTRSSDVFIPLQTRADIANKANADLFISIHTNSAESKTPSGVETFILGTDRMEANLDVAMRENAVMKLESDYKTTYQGFDPNSIDSYIMFELMQNSYMDQSLRFAEQVQQRFVGHLNRSDRGVRQAAFWVLLKTACPSILFEMGFISNPEEERFLNKETSMAQMANALVNAFGAYTHREAVKKESLALEPAATPAAEQPAQTAQPAPKHDTITAQPALKTDSKPRHDRDMTATTPVLDNRVTYAVQVCASKTPLAENDPRLKGQKCECVKLNEWYKYYTAQDTDRDKVMKARKELLTLFPGCWIIQLPAK
ncbi:MAG: N-acetylmuramoyl-L-alanine amidase [Paludibacteraceae bacterium]|nr:N-acetylmuramoyl-L-alanine amidase [Paludibacteraceae bacterium]